jgi:hypothetical protein
MRAATPGLRLHRIYPTRRLCFGNAVIKGLARFFAKRLQIRGLGASHGLIAGNPIIGILLGIAGQAGGEGEFVLLLITKASCAAPGRTRVH